MDHISSFLDSLGSTPDEVAAAVRAAGVQGMRDSTSFMNPIVRHLNRSLDIGGRLEIGAGGRVLRLQMRGKVKAVPLPVAVQAFLDCFHRGLHPDLEATK